MAKTLSFVGVFFLFAARTSFAFDAGAFTITPPAGWRPVPSGHSKAGDAAADWLLGSTTDPDATLSVLFLRGAGGMDDEFLVKMMSTSPSGKLRAKPGAFRTGSEQEGYQRGYKSRFPDVNPKPKHHLFDRPSQMIAEFSGPDKITFTCMVKPRLFSMIAPACEAALLSVRVKHGVAAPESTSKAPALLR